MAKRFTDTDKWGKAWFRKLSPKMKCAWEFLRDNCDHAGVWDIDLDSMEFHIGEHVTIEEIDKSFHHRIEHVGDKLIIVTFVEFQYGNLKPDNRVHVSVSKRLEKIREVVPLKPHASSYVTPSKPLPNPYLTPSEEKEGLSSFSQRAKDKDTDTDNDTDKDTDKETHPIKIYKNIKVQNDGNKVTIKDIEVCKQAWLKTLLHFGITRSIHPNELDDIYHAIKAHGLNTAELAIFGAAFEPSFDGFNPRDCVSLDRIFKLDKTGKYKITKFLNYGSKKRAEIQSIEEKKKREEAFTEEVDECDPEKVRALIQSVFPMSRKIHEESAS